MPGIPEYHLSPEVVLVGLLPPLLYSAAIQTSLVDYRKLRGPIALLSVGLVVFTTFAVGLVAWLVVPGLPLAAGIALGAVVAPPDAVAASAVARRVGMPRKLVRLLEGESLFNDAAALVALRTAIAAIAGSITLWQVGFDFLLAAVGGGVVGVVLGIAAAYLRTRLTDLVTDTALSFAVPFVAYIARRGDPRLRRAGRGDRRDHPRPQGPRDPLRLAAAGEPAQLADHPVPAGEHRLPADGPAGPADLVEEVADSDLSFGMIVWICVAVLGATILTRILWLVFVGLTKRVRARFGGKKHVWPWTYTAVIAWAGMRGVVTLAAAFILPPDTPQRAVLLLAAFVVVAGTLLIQGTTLPRLVRRLRLPPPDPAEDALQEAAVLNDMTHVALEKLEELRTPSDPPEVIERLRNRLRDRTDSAWEQLGRQSTLAETPSDAYRRLRMELLQVEREECLKARDNGTADDVVLRRVFDRLDIEESMLDREDDEGGAETDRELRTPFLTAGSCKHLVHPWKDVEPSSADSCAECVGRGHVVGAPAHVREVRKGGLLRLVGRQARDRALPRHPPPGDAQLRAGRDVAVVLRRPPTRLRGCARRAWRRPPRRRGPWRHRAGIEVQPGTPKPARHRQEPPRSRRASTDPPCAPSKQE